MCCNTEQKGRREGREFGATPLREIKPSQIKAWQAAKIKASVGKPTLLKSLTLLGNILQRAAEDELIEHNPVRSVKRARARRKRHVGSQRA